MGKKNKSLKYYRDYGNKKKKSKKSKGGKSYYGKPQCKDVKLTLDKKDVKENRKIVMSPVDIPDKFAKNRAKCNHAGQMMSVDDYKSLTPNYAAYTPMLDWAVKKYGANHVHVCRSCFDVVVDRDVVDSDNVIDALTTLYVAVNVAVSNKRMKDDEVKSFNKMKGQLDDFRQLIEVLGEIKLCSQQNGSGSNPTGVTAGTPVNANDGSVFMR